MSEDIDGPAELFHAARKGRERNKLDRYRDFRQVFLATEAGRRVLDDLLFMARFHERTAVKGDALETYFREGQRSVALQVLIILEREPGQPPQRQQTREDT